MHTQSNRFSWLFLVLVPLIMSFPIPTAHAEGQFAAPPSPGVTYTVRANDTLWDIANRYEISVAQLTAANPDVNPDALRPGQTLTIPTKTSPVSGAIYTVKPNDTLWNIAARYGIFLNDLLAANPGVDPQRLMVGQTLNVPGGGEAVAAPAAPARATYIVRPDDTLWDIATNYGLSLDELLAANSGVDPRRLMAGQALVIPGITQQALAATTNAPPAAPAPAPVPLPTTEGLASDLAPWAQEMVDRINEKRVAGGLPALEWNDQLAAAAQGHAEDCARRNRGSHIGSDGARLPARLQRAGYAFSWQGENWANARGVDKAMQMWWNEPRGADPHVRNIMAGRATQIGIGVAKGAWGYYFIADFGAPG